MLAGKPVTVNADAPASVSDEKLTLSVWFPTLEIVRSSESEDPTITLLNVIVDEGAGDDEYAGATPLHVTG
jgi:hypothetical protein